MLWKGDNLKTWSVALKRPWTIDDVNVVTQNFQIRKGKEETERHTIKGISNDYMFRFY